MNRSYASPEPVKSLAPCTSVIRVPLLLRPKMLHRGVAVKETSAGGEGTAPVTARSRQLPRRYMCVFRTLAPWATLKVRRTWGSPHGTHDQPAPRTRGGGCGTGRGRVRAGRPGAGRSTTERHGTEGGGDRDRPRDH